MLILVNTGFLNAQTDTVQSTRQSGNSGQFTQPITVPEKFILYKVLLIQNSGNAGKGYLTNITDTELQYSFKRPRYGVTGDSVKKVFYEDLDHVTLQKQGGELVGALIGLGVGLTAGIIGGSGGEGTGNFGNIGPGAEGVVLIGALLGTLSGAVIGKIAGTLFKKTFDIRGNHESHKKMKLYVLQKIYGKKTARAILY